MSVKVDISDQQLSRAKNLLGTIPGAANRAAYKAINRAITAANQEATRQIQEQYITKNKKVITQTKKITRRATKSNLKAVIEAKGRPLPLGVFLTNPKKVPKRRPKSKLFAQVKQGGGGQIKGAFITTVQTGHIGIHHAGVFVRKKGNASLPIKQLYGPSVPQMLGNEKIQEFLSKRAKLVLDEYLEAEIYEALKGVTK